MTDTNEKILILDFGSQYTQLIARRIRQKHIYCEIHPATMSLEAVQDYAAKGVILSGGPGSVYDPGAPAFDHRILRLDVPILGICYGQQIIAHQLGGTVESAERHEYGRVQVCKQAGIEGPGARLLAEFDTDTSFEVWMSHGDRITALPDDFVAVAGTESTPYAVIAHQNKPIFGLQFHPEVTHTPRGMAILEAWLDMTGVQHAWTMHSFLDEQAALVQEKVGPNEQVICGLSGGVDSSVVAALLWKALGKRVKCIFVDNGLLREGEADEVRETFANAVGMPIDVVDASKAFVSALKGVIDPEKKRKIIGATFIDVFQAEADKLGGARFLAQGTLYPDVIESVSFKGPSATIKSHHNVGGLPEAMKLELIEPLRELFKDEVRELGLELGLPREVCFRQPFPGPGLAVRIIGEVTEERLRVLRQADAIVQAEIRRAGWYDKCWQSFAVLLPVQSVGVMGDERTYEQTIAVRCVGSVDGMTADWSHIPYDVLGIISNRIINEVRGVNRVTYDISSKPPATIEWE